MSSFAQTHDVRFRQDPVKGKVPGVFSGEVAVDGDALPWSNAPLGSLYVRYDAGNVNVYVKTAANVADADWVALSQAGHSH